MYSNGIIYIETMAPFLIKIFEINSQWNILYSNFVKLCNYEKRLSGTRSNDYYLFKTNISIKYIWIRGIKNIGVHIMHRVSSWRLEKTRGVVGILTFFPRNIKSENIFTITLITDIIWRFRQNDAVILKKRKKFNW